MIEAHRLEAKELRRKQEIERRKNQEKARQYAKFEDEKKLEARKMAQKFLQTSRQDVIQRMHDEGTLVE